MTQNDGRREVAKLVDESWPSNFKKAINELRDGYTHIVDVARKENELQERWNSSFAQENAQMQIVLTELQADVEKLSESKHREAIESEELHKLRESMYELKNKVQELRAEKKKLEYVINGLMKSGEQNKEKLKRIQRVCDE